MQIDVYKRQGCQRPVDLCGGENRAVGDRRISGICMGFGQRLIPQPGNPCRAVAVSEHRQSVVDAGIDDGNRSAPACQRQIRMVCQTGNAGAVKDVYKRQARESYLNRLYAEVDRHYGSMDAFLREGLGLGEEEKRELRENYLE